MFGEELICSVEGASGFSVVEGVVAVDSMLAVYSAGPGVGEFLVDISEVWCVAAELVGGDADFCRKELEATGNGLAGAIESACDSLLG